MDLGRVGEGQIKDNLHILNLEERGSVDGGKKGISMGNPV